jgi:thiamine monophosphate synthase
MAESCLLYYITDRTAFPGDEFSRRRRLLEKISEAARAGVDYIQLREKDLPTRDLESLAREAVKFIAQLRTENRELRTALLINSRTDVALAVGADGVHLRSTDISPKEVRRIWTNCRAGSGDEGSCGAGTLARQLSPPDPLIAVSCHSPAEVIQAATQRSNLRRLRPSFREEGHSRRPARGPHCASPSLRSRDPSAGPRRNHSGERSFLPGRRSRRHRRHPPLPGKRYCKGGGEASLSYPVHLGKSAQNSLRRGCLSGPRADGGGLTTGSCFTSG